jgi:type II secretory pathway component PulC
VPQLPARPKNTLYRDEVDKAKAAGLGHFFERIELEPLGDTDENGRMISFEGFQIVALRPARDWLNFDFAPGDLLTHLNGVSVEHYSTWFNQFEALSKSEQIRVDLVRDGKPKTIIIRIIDRT